MSGGVVSLVLFTACFCLLQEARAGSYMMNHPQRTFCDADYVFKFEAMQMVGESSNGREKRNRTPRKQMVEVTRIYKGEKMMVPIMTLTGDSNNPVDSFSAATRIECAITFDPYKKEFKKKEKGIFFGKMFRYGNKTMMPASVQRMTASIANTMSESSVTKIMKRGLRKKYAKGCKQGCKVETRYSNRDKPSKDHCYWNAIQYRPPQVDCRKTMQFCTRGKDGICQWKETKEYKRCLRKNKMP